MVSQETIDIINYTKDLDIEFNTKLIVLFTLLVYCVVMYYLSFKIKDKSLWQVLLKHIILRWATLPYIVLFFIPMMMVYRGVALEAIFMAILQGYIILFVVLGLLIIAFGLDWIGTYLGFDDLGEKIKIGINRRMK